MHVNIVNNLIETKYRNIEGNGKCIYKLSNTCRHFAEKSTHCKVDFGRVSYNGLIHPSWTLRGPVCGQSAKNTKIYFDIFDILELLNSLSNATFHYQG